MKNLFDYLIIIIPILISLFALFISIYTARKQNKIALLEKRFTSFVNCQYYFHDRKYYQTATDKFCDIRNIFKKRFEGEENYLFVEIELLFSKNSLLLFHQLSEVYTKIHGLEFDISFYFDHLIYKDSAGDEFRQVLLNLYQQDETLDLDTEIKKISDKYTLTLTDPENITSDYNYYNLKSEIKECEKKASIIFDDFIKSMKNDIAMDNNKPTYYLGNLTKKWFY